MWGLRSCERALCAWGRNVVICTANNRSVLVLVWGSGRGVRGLRHNEQRGKPPRRPSHKGQAPDRKRGQGFVGLATDAPSATSRPPFKRSLPVASGRLPRWLCYGGIARSPVDRRFRPTDLVARSLLHAPTIRTARLAVSPARDAISPASPEHPESAPARSSRSHRSRPTDSSSAVGALGDQSGCTSSTPSAGWWSS